MYTTFKISSFVLIFIVLTSWALAQNGAGSGYSRFGVGDIRYLPGERSGAMGGSAIALLGTSSLSTVSSAAWTQLNRMRFSVSAGYEGYALKDATSSTFLSTARFGGVTFGVPVSTDNGIVIGAGLVPYSTVNFDLISSYSEAGYTYTLKQIGEGGLTAAQLGVSAKRGNDWHFGFMFHYLFGTLKHNTEQTFTSASLTNTHVTRSTRLSGTGVSLGVIFSGVGEILNLSETDQLSIGTVFTTGSRLSTKQEVLYEYLSGSTVIGHDTTNVKEGTSLVPLKFGVGLSYTTKERYVLAADLLYQNWNQATLLDSHPAELRDSYRLSIGGEILPHKKISASYWERTAYRLGFFYNASNLRIGNTGINEFGITGGFGLPMFGDTRFNIGVEYSIRGTLNLEKDNVLRVMFTLNTSELWFYRPPEE